MTLMIECMSLDAGLHDTRLALQVMPANTVPPMNGEVASSTSSLRGLMWRTCFTTA